MFSTCLWKRRQYKKNLGKVRVSYVPRCTKRQVTICKLKNCIIICCIGNRWWKFWLNDKLNNNKKRPATKNAIKRNWQSIADVVFFSATFKVPLVLCFSSSHHTHLIECIHFQSESIHTWHATDHMEIRQLRCKVGLKGDVMEVLISYLWLTTVLEFQKKEMQDLESWNHWTSRRWSLGGKRYSPSCQVGSGEYVGQKSAS